MNNNLFRTESIDAQKAKLAGKIIISQSFSFTFFTYCSLFTTLIISFFIIWGSYTKRSTVKGQITPESGLIQVYTPQQGTIIKKNIHEGKKVKAGDTLYVISTTSYGENGDIMAALSHQTQLKENSIRNEVSRMHTIHDSEKKTIINQISSLNENLIKVNNLLINQNNRVNLAIDNQKRYEKALKQNAASDEEFEIRKIDYFDQISKYESLQREKITLEKQIKEQKINLDSLKNKHLNAIEQLDRLSSSNTKELIEIQLKRHIAIRANISGIISTSNVEIGQFVDVSRPLVTILPEDTTLIAQLYVPSRAIGFVKEGNQVLLRYQAYPYQKFGHAKARVLSVARTAIAGKDLTSIGIISPQEQLNNEPVYLVRVKLEKQIVKAYGEDMPLKVGMLLEGDILHETRKLYEWALEPLLSITGKL